MSTPSLLKSKYIAFPSVVVPNDSKFPDRIPMQLTPLTTLRPKRRNLKRTVKLPFGRASVGENKDLYLTPNERWGIFFATDWQAIVECGPV